MTLPEQIKRLRELEAKATPGEWYANRRPCMDGYIDTSNSNGGIIECVRGSHSKVDAELIAETRNALPVLLDALEGLQSANIKEWNAFPTVQENLRLKAQLAEAKEVLEFYGNAGIYDHVHTARVGVNGECGAKARALLEKWGKD